MKYDVASMAKHGFQFLFDNVFPVYIQGSNTPYVASDFIENYRRDRRDLKEQSSKNTTFHIERKGNRNTEQQTY